MEQTVLSLQAMRAMGISSGRKAMGQRSATAPTTGDPFMAIIENMVAQMQEGQGDALALLSQFPALDGQWQLPADESQKVDPEQQALLEGFAAMLMANPTLAAQLQDQMAHNTSDAPVLNASPIEAGPPLPVETAPSTVNIQFPTPAQQQEALPQDLAATLPITLDKSTASPGQVTPQSDFQGQAPSLPADFTGVVTQLSYTETANQPQDAADSQDSLLGQHQFQNAVSQAKRKLQPQPEVNLQELSPTKIHSSVLESPVQKVEAPIQEFSVSDQLTQGITQNLAKGNSEFTIKLNPESLGEITVKLMKTAGKMTLSITAASSQTTKLINNDLTALRDAVRPMQVEVREAIHETAQTPQEMQQHFNMNSQQFSDQRRAFAWETRATHQGSFHSGQEEEILAQVSATQAPSPNGLNIYV